MTNTAPDLTISLPALVGSVLSCTASFFALCLHVFVPPPRRHFRHVLIVNLLIADLINSLNNTISGIIVVKNGHADSEATPSTGCLVNAWVGQFSVQAIDFNILIISVSVLLVVQSSKVLDDSLRVMTVIVCLLPWVPGLITSFIGLGLGIYGPVSGNWCWIQTQYLGLRYGLTHAWRIAIFLATIAIYTFIYIKLRRLFSFVKYGLSAPTAVRTANSQLRVNSESPEPFSTEQIWTLATVGASYELESRKTSHCGKIDGESSGERVQWSAGSEPEPATSEDPGITATQEASDFNRSDQRLPKPLNLTRMFLLNGYPVAYIILWLPGMANRVAESVGTSPKWLLALQASTQYIGLVNAVTYSSTEQIQRAIQIKMKRRSFQNLDT